ncbi:hypothetical protein TNCV_3407061 [Trichonephila clavipes]|nr:hypothetical protein TNCV_3407051 [Trichonephila clavipes]GFX61232.1 hypothetical protein TNCV_3407061 [Trichonephila clavipes]
MVLKATANDRRHVALCHDEFRGPRSGLCRSCVISNNNNRSIVIVFVAALYSYKNDTTRSHNVNKAVGHRL